MCFDFEAEKILDIIQNKMCEYEHKYGERSRYVKMPVYVKEILIEYARSLLTSFDYAKEDLKKREGYKNTVFGLEICPTISIGKLEDMEVF